MKKRLFAFAALLAALPLLSACGKGYDYTKHISEIRYDIFRAETDEFSVTLSLSEREYPYADDGIACPLTSLAEISLVPVSEEADFSVFVEGETEWGGEMSFRNVKGDYYYSQSIEEAPEGAVTLRVEWENETREIVALSVRTETTVAPEKALAFAVEAEKETVSSLMREGVFCGEFRIRLLRRDATYYYVGIVSPDGRTLSLLLDSESGEVLARRTSG